jgi:N-acetylglucosaminyl-diphospho-decaprenol L-rhamnosyltransferase
MSRRPHVDALIVAHDSGHYLQRAVASLTADLDPSQIIVVDTESTDDAVERAAAAFPGLVTLREPNRGFAAANNTGLRRTDRPWVLLLNPDAELRPGALRAMLARAGTDAGLAIVGAKIVNPDGSLQANAFGRFPSLVNVLALHAWRLWQRARGNRTLSPRDFSRPKPVEWTTGACMLVRRAAIEEVGGLDEQFFLYYEDVDWCRRMREGGWRIVVEPTALCVHHLGESGGGAGSPRGRAAYRAAFEHYCAKHGLQGLALASRLGGSLARRLPA